MLMRGVTYLIWGVFSHLGGGVKISLPTVADPLHRLNGG